MVEQSSVKKKQTQGRGLHRWIASAAGLALLAASVPAWSQAVEEMPSAADSAGVGGAVEEMPSAADSVGVSSNNSSGSGDAPSPKSKAAAGSAASASRSAASRASKPRSA